MWTTASTFHCFDALSFSLLCVLYCRIWTTALQRNVTGVGLELDSDLSSTMHLSHWVLQGVLVLPHRARYLSHSLFCINDALCLISLT